MRRYQIAALYAAAGVAALYGWSMIDDLVGGSVRTTFLHLGSLFGLGVILGVALSAAFVLERKPLARM